MTEDHDSQPSAASSLAVLGRLQSACASDTAASVMAAHMSMACAARLHSASSQGVVIEIPNPPTTEFTILGHAASVSFSIGAKVAHFVTPVTALQAHDDGTLLATVELPTRLELRERRSAVRIPVPDESLQASLLGQGFAEPVRAIDVSLTGILIEVTDAQQGRVAVGSEVTLSLTLGEAELVVTAQVCRRDRLRFGLQYKTDGRPPKGLTRMIYEIQQSRRPSR